MSHNLPNLMIRFADYIRGFINIFFIETPRYSFIIQDIEIAYPNNLMAASITYAPLGCYRPLKKYANELNLKDVTVRFKPEHARIIVGIHTLESCLDLSQKEHAAIYLSFIESCLDSINNKEIK